MNGPVVDGLNDRAFVALVKKFRTHNAVFEAAFHAGMSLRKLCKKCGINPYM